MNKNDTVYYKTRNGLGGMVRARIERVHRDGTVTVKALFPVDEATGDDLFGYLGYRYRLPRERLFGLIVIETPGEAA